MFRYTLMLGLVVGCLASGAAATAATQSGQVSGRVVDATGAVLPGATVTLRGGPDGPLVTQTDAQGRFRGHRPLARRLHADRLSERLRRGDD